MMETDWLLSQAFLQSHPREAALVLERLSPEEAAALLDQFSPAIAASVLQRMIPVGAAECLARVSPEQAGSMIAVLPLDIAAGLLRRMTSEAQERLLLFAAEDLTIPLRRLLQYPEGTAGSLMDPRALALPHDITAREALERVRRSPRHARYYLYVLDRDQRLAGVINLRELMLAPPNALLVLVMHTHVTRLVARADHETIVAHPGWRDFHSLPVVDEAGIFLGAIRYGTLRRLENTESGASMAALSPLMAFGELCWIGLTEVLADLAATLVPRVDEKQAQGKDQT